MKFVALTALIATAAAADDWAICTGNSDCATAGSKCCSAAQSGKSSAKICAPSKTTIVPNGIVTYGGYTVSCSATTSNESTGANKLATGFAVIMGAVYMLA